MTTRIEWTDAVWNPVTGCSKVSQGCKNCYAERMSKRLAGRLGYPADNPFKVTLHPDRLELPLRWRKPRRIFVNSMSDLFHEDVPDEFIDRVFAVMALCPQHTFQVLTKRPERMAQYISSREHGYPISAESLDHAQPESSGTAKQRATARIDARSRLMHWPLPDVWLGVSVENQQAADERIPLLLQTPAAVRFISAEPLLGPVDLQRLPFRGDVPYVINALTGRYGEDEPTQPFASGLASLGVLDWVIVGGESGPGARPMHLDWARQIRDACKAAGVAFMFKQRGEWTAFEDYSDHNAKALLVNRDGRTTPEFFGWGCETGWAKVVRVGKKTAGRLLDGVLHDEYPGVR